MYGSKEDLANAIDWEGGIFALVLDYGLSIEDLPPNTPEDIIEAFNELIAIGVYTQKISDWLDEE